MPVRLHPDKSGLTSRAFVATGSNCAYCWAASAAVPGKHLNRAAGDTPPAAAAGSLLPDLEIVAHLLDAVDGARNFTGPRLHGRRIDEPGQLHHTLLRFHVDLVRLGRRILRELRLDRRRQHAVIDGLA